MVKGNEGGERSLERERLHSVRIEGGMAESKSAGEDAGFFVPGFSIVCDGAGGIEGGALASKVVVETIRDQFGYLSKNSNRSTEELPVADPFGATNKMLAAIVAADQKIHLLREEFLSQNSDVAIGETTAVVNFFFRDRANKIKMCVGGIGDSGCFLFRNNELKRLIPEDSLLHSIEIAENIVIDINERTINKTLILAFKEALSVKGRSIKDIASSTIEELKSFGSYKLSQARNIYTQSLGGQRDLENQQIHIITIDMQKGDLIISCSDGLTDNTTMALFKDKIRGLIVQGCDAARLSEELKEWAIQLQNDRNNPFVNKKDDITVVIHECL